MLRMKCNFTHPRGVILWMFTVLICWVRIAETQATLMSGGCERCCHRRGLMFLRPNQPDYFPGFGPVMAAPQASPMHMKPLLHIYVIPQQHSPHASSSSSFTVLPHRCFKCKIAVNIHACFKGGHLITFSEGSLPTVASVTSHCRPLYREGELLRESNSAVREESCLHCCRRRCGRGARLQKGRTKSPIYTQSQLKNVLTSIMHTKHKTEESLQSEKSYLLWIAYPLTGHSSTREKV